jgi:hypothetical protein
MVTFAQFLQEKSFLIENLLSDELNELLEMIGTINEEQLIEGASFELGGKKYYTAWGKYFCDGKQISKEEYFKASNEYKKSFKGGSGSLYKKADNTEKKSKKVYANAAIAKNDAIKNLKSCGSHEDGSLIYQKEIDDVNSKYKNLMYHTKVLKVLKQYIKDPNSLSKEDKKMVKDNMSHNLSKTPAKLLKYAEENVESSKFRFEKVISSALRHAEEYKKDL